MNSTIHMSENSNLKVKKWQSCRNALAQISFPFFTQKTFQPSVYRKPKNIQMRDEIREKASKDLVKYVSHYVGMWGEKAIFYQKTIIIKEDDLQGDYNSLKTGCLTIYHAFQL